MPKYESIFIRVNNPTLKRNIGKYNLPHICDIVLFNTLELKDNTKQEPQEPQVHKTAPVLAITSRTGSIVGENISHRPDEAIFVDVES